MVCFSLFHVYSDCWYMFAFLYILCILEEKIEHLSYYPFEKKTERKMFFFAQVPDIHEMLDHMCLSSSSTVWVNICKFVLNKKYNIEYFTLTDFSVDDSARINLSSLLDAANAHFLMAWYSQLLRSESGLCLRDDILSTEEGLDLINAFFLS